MPPLHLAPHLVALLQGHGVEAALRDDKVYLPRLDLWANLWMVEAGGGAHLVEVVATASPDVAVTDRCAGFGATPEAALADGIHAFCSGTFHVLLAAVWGVLERSQVDHEVRTVGERDWNLYLGPCNLRSANAERLVPPKDLFDRVLDGFDHRLEGARVHTARVYLGVLDGAVTVEVLVDDEPDDALAEAVRCASWDLPKTGFASLRWFIAACPRVNGPSHSVERESCSE